MEIVSINRIHWFSFRSDGNVIFGLSVAKSYDLVIHFFFLFDMYTFRGILFRKVASYSTAVYRLHAPTVLY